MELLTVRGLEISIPIVEGRLRPVRGVDLSLISGETLGIVGESGCGKSLTSLGLMGLLPRTAQRKAESLLFKGQDLQSLDQKEMARLRGNKISMIFQEPMTSLNPCYTIGNQMEEGIRRHLKVTRREARDRAMDLLKRVGIANASSRLKQYPHQLSGGLRQRVMIAMALMCRPELLIADEPTTALDVTIQAQILALLADIQQRLGLAMIFITHDLGVITYVADRVMVMYAGQIVETGTVKEVFSNPLHPYTRGLLVCIPIPGRTVRGSMLGTIPGVVPSLIGMQKGCAFVNRCPFLFDDCREIDVPMIEIGPGRAYRCLLPMEIRPR